jgi:murein DD-endopeptidase MepM/ murein hydrolase activator NlpD
MADRKRMVLVVPARGARVRSTRVRVGLMVLTLVFLLCGFAGYFIPFSSLTVDVVEQNQQKNLAEQNKALLQRILSSLKLLNELRAEARKLDSQKARLEKPAATTGAGVSSDAGAKKPARGAIGLTDLTVEVDRAEGRTLGLYQRARSGTSPLDSIPALVPIAGDPVRSAGFSRLQDPFTGVPKWHRGMDFVAARETPVMAAAAGVVESTENDREWGLRVRIRHGYGLVTVYSHLGSVRVTQGRRVRRGECIGTVGASGLTTGPHLHYEVWKNGVAVDPEDYFFPAQTVPPSSVASAN